MIVQPLLLNSRYRVNHTKATSTIPKLMQPASVSEASEGIQILNKKFRRD